MGVVGSWGKVVYGGFVGIGVPREVVCGLFPLIMLW